ncbi:G-type lectin S-receptor-like serine/threonine-protein kinase At5g24080 [Salvia hispanica]|uniref:G-type lectin S-receptor-like serine/threonine-protein kinase At5g24080 n=1 Tax=Salvia hispanica TaxID=49212 RepID=UPI002008F9AD|nr:G-type lectin S-receptor-like serine/threonine-protein kinase At5g24080 [Salvia hispanica]
MKIHVFALLITINLAINQSLSASEITTGYQVTLAVPSDYTKGFVGRAFLIKTDQNPPYFSAAISVEAVEEAQRFSCSLDVFLGEVRVWSSAHFSRFYVDEQCVLEFNDIGDLRLKGQNERVGWKSGTSTQGVKRLSLLRTGNLVLVDEMRLIKWQSFNFPTDVMVWGQRLSSKTRLTSFPPNSTLFYSMEIKDEKIELFLNDGKSRYSYWEYKPIGGRNITFVELSSYGLEIFNGKHRYDQIRTTATSLDPLRFLSLDNNTGNLRMYHYSEVTGKFEASYQALNFTCDLPLACKSYGICLLSGSCSCIRLVGDVCNEAGGACGARDSEMVELKDVVSVLTSESYKDRVGKQECSRLCNEDCACVAAQYVEDEDEDEVESLGKCFLYGIARGIRKVERENERVAYIVKVGRGLNDSHSKNFGLKKWVIIVVVVVDVFIILIILCGVGYYFFWKKKRNLAAREQAS